MKVIRCARNADGTLHADNANHPGITEANMVAVLTGPAYVAPDPKRKNTFRATAATEGVYDLLTVVYRNGRVITAITAYPARRESREAYMAAVNEGSTELWIPANDTQ